jgi:putative aldouronate transport system substrate-binding protein
MRLDAIADPSFEKKQKGCGCMQRFKTIRPVLAIALSVGLVAGCAGRSTGSDPSSEGAAGADGPTTLKVMTILYGNPPAETNNEAKADIEKRGNVKLDIEFVPADAYADKLSVAVASDTGYDLMLFEGRSDKYVNLARQGAFHDLTPYLKGKDNLNYMPEAIWKNSMVQGKAYGVPRPRGLYGGGEASFLLRKDWLDKLNLKVPTTLDEMTQVLRAFRDNDPAGGGKTIPMVAFARDEHVFGATSAIFYPFGVPNYYTIENGTPKYLIQTEGYKRYLEWLRMAYAEKLIDKDAPILKQQQAREKFYAGIAGAFVFHVGGLNDANYDLLRKWRPARSWSSCRRWRVPPEGERR